jgi:CspA family cold shock protein
MKGSVMAIGTVKWFNSKKRYGFIVPDEGGKDVFVHMTAIEQSGMAQLVEGQRVNFKILNEPRGLQAVDLSPADDVEESAEAADQEEAEAADPEEAEAADPEEAEAADPEEAEAADQESAKD